MSKNEKLVLAICCLWTLGNAMSAVFVNVYLYAYTGSLVVMSIYCMIRIGLFPLFFTIAGKWAQRKNFAQTLTIGLIVTMLSLIYILFANDQFAVNPNLVYVVAAIVGIGESFFWLSVISLHQLVTNEDSRAKYIGNMGILNNIANIIAPLSATFMIEIAPSDVDGYINIFKIVIVIYAFIAFISMKVKCDSPKQSFSVMKTIKLKTDAYWRFNMISSFLFGIRDSLILTLAGLLVYNATGGSGSSYSKLLAVFAVITIISYYVVSRRLKKHNILKYYNIGAILIASSTIALVVNPTVNGAIYYGIVNAIASPMYANPYQIIYMNAIEKFAKSENIIGRVIARETYLSLGRCFGMLCIVISFLILPEDLYLLVSVIFCSMFPIIVALYANYYLKNKMDNEPSNPYVRRYNKKMAR